MDRVLSARIQQRQTRKVQFLGSRVACLSGTYINHHSVAVAVNVNVDDTPIYSVRPTRLSYTRSLVTRLRSHGDLLVLPSDVGRRSRRWWRRLASWSANASRDAIVTLYFLSLASLAGSVAGAASLDGLASVTSLSKLHLGCAFWDAPFGVEDISYFR